MIEPGLLRLPKGERETAVSDQGQTSDLALYLPRIALQWMAEDPGPRHRRVEGTLLFVDVSGFTALTERLAGRGKVGAEEITDVIGGVFGELLGVAISYGADLLKWGGDAVLLHFAEPDSASRACRAAMLMIGRMRQVGQIRTSAGRVTLRVSIGAHSGTFDLYLLGDHHRELIVTGPEATVTAQMEGVAEAGEVVVSPQTAARLPPGVVGAAKGDGFLLRAVPEADRVLSLAGPLLSEAGVSSLMPTDRRLRLQSGGEQAEHRQATVAFLEFSGVDALTREGGGELVAEHLDPVVCASQAAAERYGVNFHETDIGPDGGKIVLLGGVPMLRGRDAERALRTAYDVVNDHPRSSPLRLRAGVNAGRVFVFCHNFAAANRRVFAVTGDTVNLAARVMGKTGHGRVVATEAALVVAQNPFLTERLPPFKVKGKAEPVMAAALVAPRHSDATEVGDAFPFVGREVQLTEILQRAALAVDGSGSVIEIVGPAGIGKSRLVTEAIERWPLDTSRVPCEDYQSATPYWPFRRILRRMLGVAPDAPPEMAVVELRRAVSERVPHLEPFLPLLADVVDLPVPSTPQVDELEQRFRRPRLENCVVELLRTYLSAPAALVIEDVQSIDAASASLLGRLAGELTDLPVLIVLTRRGQDASPDALTERVPVFTIELEPLGADAAGRLASTDGSTLSPGQVAAIVERADGNPLFLRELLRNTAETGGLEALPDSIEPLLVAQIDRLSASDRQVLRAAAVLGLSFNPDDVSKVLDGEADVNELVWSRLGSFVAPTAIGWRFAHALMRDAAYEGLAYRRRRQLHGRAAQAIADRVGSSDEAADVLSLHWLHAEAFEQAWHYARVAGDRARALWANSEAAILYARAMEAAGHLSLPPSVVAEVAELLGDARELTGSYSEARRAYSRARRLTTGDVKRAELLRKMGVLQERQGRYREALACYTRARRLVPPGGAAADKERCELDLAAAGIRSRQGRFAECARLAEQAAGEAKRARYRSGLAHALYLQHDMSVYLSRPVEEMGRRSLAIFEELGDLLGQGNALNNLGVEAYYKSKWDDALDLWARSRDARARAGDVVGAATEENNLAEILSDQGRFAEARPLLEEALATWRAAGYRVGVALATSNLGRLEGRAGDVRTGHRLLDEALEAFRDIGSSFFTAEARLRIAEVQLLAGDFAGAAGAAKDLLSELRGSHGQKRTEVAALRVLGTAAGLGDPEAGRPWLDEAVERAAALDALYELALALSCRHHIDPGEDSRADRRRADELFSALGVRCAVITWSPRVTEGPLLAYGQLM